MSLLIPKNENINPKQSPIHENTNANINCDFGDDRCQIAPARLEKDIFVILLSLISNFFFDEPMIPSALQHL